MALGITRIDHVQIGVPRSLERECVAFYRGLLGLAEIAKPEELPANGGAWFQIANVQLHIGLDDEASPPRKRHVGFLVTDLGLARAHAGAAGLVIEEQTSNDRAQRFFIRDPAGNRIEIGQG